MRNWIAAAAAVFALTAAPARAGLFGRSKLDSRWTVVAVAINGDDVEWKESSAFEEDGLSVLAMNDALSLYLLVTAHTREARDQLSGESHQDVTLWFVGADGKTRDWGARIPFSHRSPLTSALRDPAGLDPEPEFVHYEGTAISTASLPGDVQDRLAASGRRPIWELKIPLKRLAISPEKAVAMDFVLNAPPAGTKRPQPARAPEKGDRKGEGHPEELVWNALSYALSVHLAPNPSQPR
jgi:hypothetical protein